MRRARPRTVDFELPNRYAALRKDQQHYMRVACQEACKSLLHHKHGAVLVYKGEIISTGFNNFKSGKCVSLRSIHAEMDAIMKVRKIPNARNILKNCDIYVVRVNSENDIIMSKPCCECSKLIRKFNLKRAFWSDDL